MLLPQGFVYPAQLPLLLLYISLEQTALEVGLAHTAAAHRLFHIALELAAIGLQDVGRLLVERILGIGFLQAVNWVY